MKIELSVFVDETGAVKAHYDVDVASEVTAAEKELCYNRLAEVVNHKVDTERHVSVTKIRAEVEMAESANEVEIRKMNYEADTKKREMISANHTVYLEKMSEVHEIILDKTEAHNHTAMQAMHQEIHSKFLDAMKKDEE